MNTKRALPILFAVMFLVMVGFGIIIPVLPFFAEQLGATPAQLGWLMAVYSLMQFIFAPMWGGISDRIGRKPVMLIGIAGLSLSFFLFAVSTQLWMLFAARILAGFLSSANMPTTMAYVADVTTPENRGKGMGIIGAAVGLGFIFGPAIGGIFSKTSLNMPFFIAGTVSAITFLFVLFFLKESLPPEKRTVRTPGTKESRWKAFSGPTSVLYILQFFVSFSLAGLEATFAYFAFARAGIGTTNLGYIFMIMGLAGAVVQGGLVGRLTKKFGEGAVIQMGLVVSAIGFGLILLTDSFVTAAIFLTVFGLGNGVIRPSVSALITKRTEVGQGSATGLLSSFDSLGRIAGPPIGGALYSMQIGLPYISGLIVSAIAFILYRFYMKKEQKTSLPA
ncbi:MFS transporter [Aneurinibacillus aneurinilyticus]|uniref:TCR/Tet family MFS transporter n=1 Tax=Aneurinibacillus aneurinilyticus TaxID=1391 RepID=A0A848CVT7_ANEAE|nr:MFS transporter [Aneurinibacillus aneurinilyticus]MED0668758.1 MFS transporter [Aneurinibacillus aneurinilyticus]NME99625.1 TCR/Tet family MFS transporter [Aneurinibacillus aneurinilyticus]